MSVRSLKSEAAELVKKGKYSLATEKINEALIILQTTPQFLGRIQAVVGRRADEELLTKSQLEYARWMTAVGNIVNLVKSGAIKRAKDIIPEVAQLPREYQSEITPNYFWHYVSGLILLGEKKYLPAVDEFEQAISLIDGAALQAISDDLKHHLIVNAIIAKAWTYYLGSFDFRAHWSLTEKHRGLEGRSLLEMHHNDRSFSAFACFVIGYILYVRGETQMARSFLEDGKVRDDASPLPWYLEAYLNFGSNDSVALECYEEVLKRNENFAEARNNKAVILARRKDYFGATVEIMKAISMKPSLAVAHKNLVKITTEQQNGRHDNFWEFWTSSDAKRITAVLLVFAATLPFIYTFINGISDGTSDGPTTSSDSKLTEKNTTVKEITSGNNATSKEIVTTTKESAPSDTKNGNFEIPNSYLVWVGIIIAILVIPQLKSAKFAGVEIELTTADISTVDTTLDVEGTDILEVLILEELS